MELILIMMIVGVCGVWIYGLKQEIATLQKRLPPEQLELHHSAPAPQPIRAQESDSRSDVQTWVLE